MSRKKKKHDTGNIRKEKQLSNSPIDSKSKNELPKSFPFWARLKIGKRRTTLVIDDTSVIDKKKKKLVDGYVHREALHTEKSDYEEIVPNPDKSDKERMFLKRPKKLPKTLFKSHNKDLDMPEDLKQRYAKNNDKKDK